MADNTEPQRPLSDETAKPKRRRGPGRPFPKGVSPNPGGRPKSDQELKAKLDAAAFDSIELLHKVVVGDIKATPHVRVQAAKVVLDKRIPNATETDATAGDALKALAAALMDGPEGETDEAG